MRKIIHYYYACGHEIQIFQLPNRQIAIKDQNGNDPVCPIVGEPAPFPNEERWDQSAPAYDELGLYYRYAMPDSGWDGDC